MSEFFDMLWAALNSPAGITAMAGVLVWVLNRLYAAKPMWARFEGAIISAIKFAEKEIPEDTSSKGLAKLDRALQYVLRVYQESTGKRATPKVASELKEGIQLTHDRLETAGKLG